VPASPSGGIQRERERERERKRERRESWRGRGVIETEFSSLEGSQAVSASPSGKGKACIRDLFNFYF
jgi:hypothetical protein